MVTFLNHANFSYSSVLTPPSSGGNSSTQLTIQAGDQSLFPGTPFNIVVWPANVSASQPTYPTAANATIVKVTLAAANKFTFVRQQEGSNDRTIIATDQVALADTAKLWTDIETGLNNLNFFNVLDYGAIGDNTTDDTAAIQSAINAANAAGGGTVLYPNKEFKLTSALTTYSSIRHLGMSSESTILHQTNTSADVFDTNDASSIWIENLLLLGPGSGTGSGMFLTWTLAGNIPFLVMKHVIVKNFGSDGINIATPIVSTFDTVECRGNGRYGFNFVQGGTSTTFRNTYAVLNLTAGYRFYQSAYINLEGTASDNNGINYLIDGAAGIVLNAPGSESQTGTAGIKINNSNAITINGFWTFNNTSIAIWVTGGSQNVSVIGAYDATPNASATAFIQVDSGCSATVSGIANTTANSFATGTTMTLNDNGNGDILIPGSMAVGGTSLISRLTLPAGTASAHHAPLKLTAGTNLTTPEAGAIEFDGTSLYYTDSTPTRHALSTGAFANPMTTLGDTMYENATPAAARLAGNTSATLAVLTQTGNGTISAAPVWTTSTGTGSVVLATSPTLVTPTLGVASATTINKVTLTTPATGSTLTIADGKTLTVNNSLTFAGNDSTTFTFPNGSGTVVTLNATQTLTNKTLTTPTLTSPVANDIVGSAFDIVIHFTATGSGVDWIEFTNANTANPATVTMGAAGSDSNIHLNLTSKGSGVVQANGVAVVTTTGTQTLTNKTLTGPVVDVIVGNHADNVLSFTDVGSAVDYIGVSNAATANPATVSINATGTDTNINLNLTTSGSGTVQANGVAVVTLSGTQTLTNKTLTSPVIATIVNTGTLTLPTSTDTLVGRATTDTFTNKTFSATATGNVLSNVGGVGNFTADYLSGWQDVTETWTYVSATSFKVSGTDITGRNSVGDMLRLKQGAGYLYFYITAISFSTDTTVTITGGSDYTLANATITNPGYALRPDANGFPQWFNYTPTWTGGSPAIGNGTLKGRFNIVGRQVTNRFYWLAGSTTTFGNTTWVFGLPVMGVNALASAYERIGYGQISSAGTSYVAYSIYNSTTNNQFLGSVYNSAAVFTNAVPGTWANGDTIWFTMTYEI